MDDLRNAIFNYNSRTRIKINVEVRDECMPKPRVVTFFVDTGAKRMSVPSQLLGIKESEEEFIAKCKTTTAEIGGIVPGVKSKYQSKILDEIDVGGIVLRKIPFNITFNPDAKVSLLGMSVIGLFNTLISAEDKIIMFNETTKLAEYTHNNLPIIEPEKIFEVGSGGANSSVYFNGDIQARYIQSKLMEVEKLGGQI